MCVCKIYIYMNKGDKYVAAIEKKLLVFLRLQDSKASVTPDALKSRHAQCVHSVSVR